MAEALHAMENNTDLYAYFESKSPARGLSEQKRDKLKTYLFGAKENALGMYFVSADQMLDADMGEF